MKVSIVGGGGLVGSMTAYALQCGGKVSSLCLIDANKDMAQGQALDLLNGASLAADQRISAGDMAARDRSPSGTGPSARPYPTSAQCRQASIRRRRRR